MTALLTDTEIICRFQTEIQHPVFAKRLLEDLYRRYPDCVCSIDMKTKFLLSTQNYLASCEAAKFNFAMYASYLWLLFLIKGLPSTVVDKTEYQLKLDDSKFVFESAQGVGERFLLSDLSSEIAIGLNQLNQLRLNK
jgi:hypothetical protein